MGSVASRSPLVVVTITVIVSRLFGSMSASGSVIVITSGSPAVISWTSEPPRPLPGVMLPSWPLPGGVATVKKGR